MKGDIKTGVSKDMFRQTKPCSDCPFRKPGQGGVQHGLFATFQYASYFTHDPGATFPCHETRRPGQDNGRFTEWTEGPTLCAGGLIFAEKVKQANRFLQTAQARGLYDPKALRDTDAVCDNWLELAVACEREIPAK
jgi:hypothetical protein